ncbi:MAG TPA: uracil phosphoribosyltransferase [Chlamydiales bacterium]|nr:uracil phosphoribosyltransferase [Chlamydiales bacterium]
MKKMTACCIALSSLSTASADIKFALNQLVYEIRNPQTMSKDFRTCVEKIGEYLAMDVYEHLKSKEVELTTLTGGVATHSICVEDPVLVALLRGGLPLCLGAQKIFPYADVGFIGIARNEETLQPKTDYVAIPDVQDRTVIIIDTMIATGGSMLDAIKTIQKGKPRKIILLAGISAESGIERILEYSSDVQIFSAAIDPLLNHKGYIVPGLGDAGDRSYGFKRFR